MYASKLVALDTSPPPPLDSQTYTPPGILGGLDADELRNMLCDLQRACASVLKRQEQSSALAGAAGGSPEGFLAAMASGGFAKSGERVVPVEAHMALNYLSDARMVFRLPSAEAAIKLPGCDAIARARKWTCAQRTTGDPAARPRWAPPDKMPARDLDTQDPNAKCPFKVGGVLHGRHDAALTLKALAFAVAATNYQAPVYLQRSAGGGGMLLSRDALAEWIDHVDTFAGKLTGPLYEAHFDRVEGELHDLTATQDFTLAFQAAIKFSCELYKHRPVAVPTSAGSPVPVPAAASAAVPVAGAPASTMWPPALSSVL